LEKNQPTGKYQIIDEKLGKEGEVLMSVVIRIGRACGSGEIHVTNCNFDPTFI
jgi:hypothetical protein